MFPAVDSSVMKCRFCDEDAVINLRYARLALCGKHFSEYLTKRVRKTMEKFRMVSPGDKVLVAVSGGKDSATLVHILHKLSNEMGFNLHGLVINVWGRDDIPQLKKAVELLNMLGVEYTVLNVKKEFGYSVYELASAVRRPACSVCGVVKRYVMNYVGVKVGATKVATGHTLEDALNFMINSIASGDLDALAKILPVTERLGEFGLPRIKPLIEVSERETLAYALVNKLPFELEACPHAMEIKATPIVKEFLNRLEDASPSRKIAMLRHMLKHIVPAVSKLKREVEVRKCRICGMPSQGEVCSFCKLLEAAKERLNKE